MSDTQDSAVCQWCHHSPPDSDLPVDICTDCRQKYELPKSQFKSLGEVDFDV